MSSGTSDAVVGMLQAQRDRILSEWLARQKAGGALISGRVREGELQAQSRGFLDLLVQGLAQGATDAASPAFADARDLLAELSRSRAVQGFTPTETATFVFSLKQPLFDALNRQTRDQAGDSGVGVPGQTDNAAATWALSLLLDAFGLQTMEGYIRSREEIIARQGREISELSTPVVKLWDGILALPLIGTLDSERTQSVMENLLEAIVTEEAEIAIIDITGVPTVDTLTAQHLIKTVAAARLMGADCMISGIRPQIAQTMVHLGVDLNVTSKATLADAFRLALTRLGRRVVRHAQVEPAAAAPRG